MTIENHDMDDRWEPPPRWLMVVIAIICLLAAAVGLAADML